MGQDVPEAGNCPPWDIRKLPRHFPGEIFYGFPDDFEIANYRVNRAPITDEGFIGETLDVGFNGKRRIKNVL